MGPSNGERCPNLPFFLQIFFGLSQGAGVSFGFVQGKVFNSAYLAGSARYRLGGPVPPSAPTFELPEPTGRIDRMNVKIKLSLEFKVSETALEDAMAEYDELTVEGLLREIIDKAIACDEISTKVDDGPNTLEEYDQLSSS
jgi:hypothetical protein